MAYTTRISMLRGVHEHDEHSWEEFQAFYTPLIFFCGRLYKLTHEELQDLRQEVFRQVATTDVTGKYDPTIARFRAYLQGVIRHCILAILRQRTPGKSSLEDLEESPAGQIEDKGVQVEFEKLLLQAALEQLREELDERQFTAFDLYALQKRPVQEVAEIMKMTVNQVYLAKSRNTARLQEILESLRKEAGC